VICLSGITYYLYNEIAFLALGRVMQVTRHASSFRRFLEPINFHLRTVPISSRMTKIFEQPNLIYQIASHDSPYIQQIELSGDDGILNFWNTRQSKIAVVVSKHRLHLGGVGI
jgi:hypothetical protein